MSFPNFHWISSLLHGLDELLGGLAARLSAPEVVGPPLLSVEGLARLDFFRKNIQRGRQADDQLASAAMALGSLQFVESEPDLIAAAKLKSTPDVVKAAICHALGRVHTEAGHKALVDMLDGPQDVAQAVWFLASSLADYVTGQVLYVDGGFKME